MALYKAAPDKRFKKAQPAYYLHANSKQNALTLIKFLLPGLIAKKEQALLAIWLLEEAIKDKIHKQDTFFVEIIDAIRGLKRQLTPTYQVKELLCKLKATYEENLVRKNWVNSGNPKLSNEYGNPELNYEGQQDFVGSAETRPLSPNNNMVQERPIPSDVFLLMGNDIVPALRETLSLGINNLV